MQHPYIRHDRKKFKALPILLVSTTLTLLTIGNQPLHGATTALPINIAQIPLTVTVPAHPQVMIAFGNSQSMDGNLSGAIMTGSGLLGNLSQLGTSSSPVNFTVPEGFTPPLSGGTVGSTQPYTVTINGVRYDNSPSRLNVAKNAIKQVLTDFFPTTDFGLLDFKTNGAITRLQTWAYYLSPPNTGFTFTDIASTNAIPNPCYNINISALSNPVEISCASLSARYGAPLTTRQYMLVDTTGDDPAINDVLYDIPNGISILCAVHGTRTPANPYPPTKTLADYNDGRILMTYGASTNGPCATMTTPTNAGYVSFAQEVMYARRGFGYYIPIVVGNDSNVLVPLQSAGSTPTPSSVATAIASFTPFLKPETNDATTTEIKATAGQSALAGLLIGAQQYFTANKPPSSNGCPPKRYVLLLTDGLPTMDTDVKTRNWLFGTTRTIGGLWPPLGSTAATGYGVTATFNTDGSLVSSNSKALTDTIDQLQTLNDQGIKTYIVGLGAGVDPSKNEMAAKTLNAMAIAGGTAQTGATKYFPATSPGDLSENLRIILEHIQHVNQAVSSNAVNSHYISANTLVYQARFNTSDTQHDWTGNLFAFSLKADGTLNANPKWDAQSQLDTKPWDERVMATWEPTLKKSIPFRWSGTDGIQNSTALGTPLTANSVDNNGDHALQYLRGNRTLEQPAGPYRTRTHVLGDIVNSSPIYIGAPNGAYFDSSYTAFIKAHANRKPMIYVGANDGMLHGFDAKTGAEVFAYIPWGSYNNLPKLTHPSYNSQHHFFVDATPVSEDVYFDNDWHTVLVGGEGAGGHTVYALDVTDPNQISSESALVNRVLWEFSDIDMGNSFGTPAIDRTAAGTVVVFGNGYNSPEQKPVFYALDVKTGTIQAKIDLCAAVATANCDTSKPNGLSSVKLTNTTGALGAYSTVAYAGDLQGHVWRIDMSHPTATAWNPQLLFKATDPSGIAQPITTAPVTSLNPRYPYLPGNMVYVGTGQMLSIADLSSTQTQSMYGIYDNGGVNNSLITRANMVEQTFAFSGSVPTQGGGSVSARTLSNNALDLYTQKGWYVDFPQGERIVSNPALDLGAVIATSNLPPTSACSTGNTAWLNLFNYATGGSFATAQLKISGTSVSGIALGIGFTTGVNVTISGDGRMILLNQSSDITQTRSFEKVGATKARSAWWEVQ